MSIAKRIIFFHFQCIHFTRWKFIVWHEAWTYAPAVTQDKISLGQNSLRKETVSTFFFNLFRTFSPPFFRCFRNSGGEWKSITFYFPCCHRDMQPPFERSRVMRTCHPIVSTEPRTKGNPAQRQTFIPRILACHVIKYCLN